MSTDSKLGVFVFGSEDHILSRVTFRGFCFSVPCTLLSVICPDEDTFGTSIIKRAESLKYQIIHYELTAENLLVHLFTL